MLEFRQIQRDLQPIPKNLKSTPRFKLAAETFIQTSSKFKQQSGECK